MGVCFHPRHGVSAQNSKLNCDLLSSIKKIEQFTKDQFSHLNSNWGLENRTEYFAIKTVIIRFVHLGLKEAIKDPPQEAFLAIQEIADRALSAIQHLTSGSTEFIQLILTSDLT